MLSAAILFAGALPKKTLRVLQFLGVQAISASTFFRHQAKYLHSTINKVWGNQLSTILEVLRGKDLVLAGDGRSDSMGHCAKYGTYSLMDLGINQIVFTSTVQVSINIDLLAFTMY